MNLVWNHRKYTWFVQFAGQRHENCTGFSNWKMKKSASSLTTLLMQGGLSRTNDYHTQWYHSDDEQTHLHIQLFPLVSSTFYDFTLIYEVVNKKWSLQLSLFRCPRMYSVVVALRRLATSVSHLVGYLIIYSAFTFEPNIMGILCLLLAMPTSLIAFSFTCLNSKDDKK